MVSLCRFLLCCVGVYCAVCIVAVCVGVTGEKCPQCNAAAKKADIRPIFTRVVRAVDTAGSLCLHIYVYVCLYVCVCVRVCMYVYMCVVVCAYMSVYVWMWVCVGSLWGWTCLHYADFALLVCVGCEHFVPVLTVEVCVCVHATVYVNMYANIHVLMYANVCVHMCG